MMTCKHERTQMLMQIPVPTAINLTKGVVSY